MDGEHVVRVLDASVRDVAVGDLLSGCSSDNKNEKTLKIDFPVELYKIALRSNDSRNTILHSNNCF